MQKFHTGLGYTTEQEQQLDTVFQEYLDNDSVAENAGYWNEERNRDADKAFDAYAELKQSFNEKNQAIKKAKQFNIDSKRPYTQIRYEHSDYTATSRQNWY